MLRLSGVIRFSCRHIKNHATEISNSKLSAVPIRQYYTKYNYDRFVHRQPPSRLGTCHNSLASYLTATGNNNTTNDVKEVESSTLIILTNIAEQKLLLGKKLRGFGTGKYNGFGGRLESEDIDKTPAHGAQRELMEETNLSIDLGEFVKGSVGTLCFTFQDREHTEMLVHLFHVNVNFDGAPNGNSSEGAIIDPNMIRACDEMIPEWFDWWEIPLHQMFADDSIWLTYFLTSLDSVGERNYHKSTPTMNGWFHFAPGGDGNNQILHYFLDAD